LLRVFSSASGGCLPWLTLSFGMDRMFAKRMITAVTVSAGCVLLVLGVGHIIPPAHCCGVGRTRNSLSGYHTLGHRNETSVVSTNNIRRSHDAEPAAGGNRRQRQGLGPWSFRFAPSVLAGGLS